MEKTKALMEKTVDFLRDQLVGMGGNINDNLISTVTIDYSGQQTPLEHLGLIHQKDRRISITPYDPSIIMRVEEELKKQGFDAYKFSKTTVVVNIPLISGDTRRKVASRMNRLGEDAKVSIRNIRRNFRKKNKDCDDKELQKMTNIAIEEIDQLISGKV